MSVIRRLPALLLLTFTLLCLPTQVWAQGAMGGFPNSSSGETQAPPSSSYGAQIALVDGASILLFLSAASSDSESTGMLSIGGYLLGGPIVHSIHGEHGRAIGSLALRVGLPVVLSRLATTLDDCDPQVEDFCGEDEMPLIIMGGMVGVLAAGAIDWFVLGRKEAKERPPGLQVGGVSLQPTFNPSASGAQLGVVGQF